MSEIRKYFYSAKFLYHLIASKLPRSTWHMQIPWRYEKKKKKPKSRLRKKKKEKRKTMTTLQKWPYTSPDASETNPSPLISFPAPPTGRTCSLPYWRLLPGLSTHAETFPYYSANHLNWIVHRFFYQTSRHLVRLSRPPPAELFVIFIINYGF